MTLSGFIRDIVSLLCIVTACQPAKSETAVVPSSGAIVAGYVASWKEQPAQRFLTKQLSHVLYAFGSVSASGLAQMADSCVDAGICGVNFFSTGVGGNFSRLAAMKRDNPQLRILISLGGWNGSKYFSDVAATEANRQRFAQSIIDVFFHPFPGLFDGIDIDWEYPVTGGVDGNHHRLDDGDNFIALTAEIRRKLEALSASDNHYYELTMAVSADPMMAAKLDLKELARHFDWIGVMAYDYNAGATVTGFNAPLFAANAMPSDGDVDRSIRYFLNAGVPSRKLVLGIPFYGRAYRDVSDNGLGRIEHGHPAEDWGGEDGIDYKDILSRRPQSFGFERHWDDKAQVPWLYNRNQQVWISYDDPDSVARKAAYARSHGLGGVMIWELSGDDGTLLPAVTRALLGR